MTDYSPLLTPSQREEAHRVAEQILQEERERRRPRFIVVLLVVTILVALVMVRYR